MDQPDAAGWGGAVLGRVAIVGVPSLLTALAFVVGKHFGVVGQLPVWVLLILLFVVGAIAEFGVRHTDEHSSNIALHASIAAQMAGVSVIIYGIGWGPTLAVGYAFVCARVLDEVGTRAWRIAVLWSTVCIVLGQVAIATDLVRTYVPTPYVHGLAGLSLLGTAFVMRLFGLKTEMHERAIVERDRLNDSIRATLSVLTATLDSTADGILLVDAAGAITLHNRQFGEMWQLPESVLAGSNTHGAIAFVLDQLIRPELFVAKFDELDADPSVETSDTLEFKDGRVFERYSRPQRIDGRVVGRVWSFRDVTDRSRLVKELAHQAFHDSLTGLANRALLRDRLEHALARSRRSAATVGVLFCDLDGFKMVNDTLGHDAGDVLLVEVARRFEHNLRDGDTAARLGGDEFAIVIEETARVDMGVLAQRLLDALGEPFMVKGREVFVRASIGLADTSQDLLDADELLRRADIAMYAAKSRGRDRYAAFEQSMQTEVNRRSELMRDLHHALLNGQLSVHYQPLIDLDSGAMQSFEALLRWEHPERGQIAPDEFIPVAEETGVILDVGRLVLDVACHQCAQWRQQSGIDGLTMCVNVSGQQLYDDQFVSDVEETLARAGLPPTNLILELTESTLLTDTAAVHRRLQQLKDMGVRLAVDDFGTGYSSLSYLHSFPVDYLKIDRSFVKGLNQRDDHQSHVMVRSIISIAHNLNLTVVAEGIEQTEQLDALVAAGCHTGQGFLLSRPVPPEQITPLLAEAARERTTVSGVASPEWKNPANRIGAE
jgi:diguanylate cyclase (GGDEF)-like protein/PAS domain S-box-containing protein